VVSFARFRNIACNLQVKLLCYSHVRKQKRKCRRFAAPGSLIFGAIGTDGGDWCVEGASPLLREHQHHLVQPTRMG
jgi:hypothetical protein